MQTLVRREPLFDFQVTTGALQLAIAAAADVTTGAVRRPVELRVRFGECAGRELGQGQRRENAQREQQLDHRCTQIFSTR